VSPRRKILAAALAVVVGIASLPAIAYAIGLSKIDGRPTPADPTQFTAADLSANWIACREPASVQVVPLNPWGYTVRVLAGDTGFEGSGQLSAWLIARAYNVEHLPKGMKWWHLSGAALTIWVTRNWSAEQIAATLIRDQLCKRRLTNRWSGRVPDKVPSPNVGVRAAQLNR
jgi:hypothetical protein